MLKETFQEYNGGVIIAGRKIKNLRFVDNTMLCTKSELEMSQLLKYVEVSNKYGLTIYRSKTKVTVVDKSGASDRY